MQKLTYQFSPTVVVGNFRSWLLGLEPKLFYTIGIVSLLLFSMVVIFYRLGDPGIINASESLYIESSREMLISGQLAIPTLNGLPYLEKPPLLVWFLAASSYLFGVSEFSYRLVTAFATLAIVISVSRFAKLLNITSTGVSAGMIFITCLGVDIMSRVAMPDMLLTCFFCLGTINFLAALYTNKTSFIKICAALLSAATMIKGFFPIALFTAIVLVFYITQPTKRAEIKKLLFDPVALLILILPMTLWLVAIEIQHPGAIYYFVINEHVLRFLGLRIPHDYYSGSVFYYVPRIFLFFFPWIGVLFFGWFATKRNQDQSKMEIIHFLWICVLVPFTFFSVSSAKANYYIIVCLPPMALLVAYYLPSLLKNRHRITLMMSIMIPVLMFVMLWMYRLWMQRTGKMSLILPQHDASLPLTIGMVLGIAVIAAFFLQNGWRRASLLCLGGLVIPLSLEINHISVSAEPTMSSRTMATYIKENYPDRSVFLYKDFESLSSLPIYLNKTLPVIDSTSSDLYFGQQSFPNHPNFVTEDHVLKSENGSLVVVRKFNLPTFTQSKINQFSKKVIEIGPSTLYVIESK
jgi:4-amino-4-deoxy-L-arabinose transferase-like glycosyltransferase